MDGQDRSRGTFWGLILLVWGVTSAILVWRILPFVTSWVHAFLAAGMSFFLLTGVFNIAVNVVSRFMREGAPPPELRERPAVAVLYCTYNDFSRFAADSLLRLTYDNRSLWILDDSSIAAWREEVDRFVREATATGQFVKLVRRPSRNGFKAGAINGALRLLPLDVRYIAVVDSDEIVVPTFIEDCLRRFTSDDVAFVQASHVCYNISSSWFTRYLGVGVDLHWRHYQRYRNRYGTVNMLGHGSIVRRDVLDLIGGFPEVTCEDLAFTAVARMAGYRGVFAADVVCGETFPPDFAAMRRRHLRWSWGTVEFLRRFALPFARSRVPLHEKIDLLLPSANLPAAVLLIAFLGAVHGLVLSNGDLAMFREPIVIAVGLLASLGPLSVFADLHRQPRFLAKVLVVNTLAYLALFSASLVGTVRGLAKPAEFLVTPKAGEGPRSLRTALSDARTELAFGAVLLALGVVTWGPVGVASPIGIAALLAPVLSCTPSVNPQTCRVPAALTGR